MLSVQDYLTWHYFHSAYEEKNPEFLIFSLLRDLNLKTIYTPEKTVQGVCKSNQQATHMFGGVRKEY